MFVAWHLCTIYFGCLDVLTEAPLDVGAARLFGTSTSGRKDGVLFWSFTRFRRPCHDKKDHLRVRGVRGLLALQSDMIMTISRDGLEDATSFLYQPPHFCVSITLPIHCPDIPAERVKKATRRRRSSHRETRGLHIVLRRDGLGFGERSESKDYCEANVLGLCGTACHVRS